MKISGWTVRLIVKAVKEKEQDISELEKALSELRECRCWEDGVEKDNRLPIKLLYTKLQAARLSLDELLNKEIKVVGGVTYEQDS